MALSSRGKAMVGFLTAVVLVGGAFVGYRVLAGGDDGGFLGIGGDEAEPERCPLAGTRATNEEVLSRRALGIKVENLDEARPQAGLNRADIVYEEPVEGGITRFIVIYHCKGANRVGPVRSGRLVDADVLAQYGQPILGYAGGVQPVRDAIEAAGVTDLSYLNAPDAYTRDPNKAAPHNLYTTTGALYEAADGGGGDAPPAVFTYDRAEPDPEGSRRGESVQLAPDSAHWRTDVVWRYDEESNGYLRFHGSEAHTVEDGSQVSARNVVIQVVDVVNTSILDAAGNPSPDVDALGRGRAIIFRDGRRIQGRWERAVPEDITTFTDRQGNEVPLGPGTTWVELYPSDGTVNFRI
jgi:hypothetical protein